MLAHGRKGDDHNGPRKQVGCLEQKLCLVDALANGAGGTPMSSAATPAFHAMPTTVSLAAHK